MSVLSLADAKAHLNITSDELDAELLAVIDAAEARISSDCGPLTATTRTDRVRGTGKDLILPVSPIISLTSVAPVGGAALDLSSMIVDYRAGIIAYVAATQYNFARFPLPWYDVVYVAGRTTVDAALLMAVKELVRFAWGPQRGGSRRPGSQPSETYANTIPGVGEELPFNVQKWLSGNTQAGFA